ncbi:MAG: DUF58 domain-containing protein [Rikenellaceae bacterium]
MDQQSENEILSKVRKVEIKSRGLTNQIFAGQYHSAFRGRGISFAEVREYRAGDDVRDIDWNVTARSSTPHIKIYEESRELTMMLMVDVSGSQSFGTQQYSKRRVASEIAAVLAFSAVQNSDKVGCILFSDGVEKYIPPKKGKGHILMIIRELVAFQPKSKGTNIGSALSFFTNVNKKRCTCFMLSDFMTTDKKSELELSNALKVARSKHDLVAIRVADPRESEMPDVGLAEFEDGETGERMLVDTSSRSVRDFYAEQWRERMERGEELLKQNRVDLARVTTDEDYVVELIKLFKKR